jgi:hypothetical protein
MKKAYDYAAGKLWIVNVGDIKPAEIAIEHFMQMAWDIDAFRENNPRKFLLEWATRDFGSEYAPRIADIMERHFELGYARRPEHMMLHNRDGERWEWFSITNYNDEAQRRVDAYDKLINEVDALYEALPVGMKDAFFQMVLYNVKGAGLHNKKVIHAQKSAAYGAAKRSSAADYARLAETAESGIKQMIDHYNTGLLTVGAKWNHMAALPGPWGAQWLQWKMPPLSEYAGEGPAKLNLALEGGDAGILPGISLYNNDKRFIDLYNSGTGSIPWRATVSAKWIRLSAESGVFDHEQRIWVSVDWNHAPKGRDLKGSVRITSGGDSAEVNVPVFNPPSPTPESVQGFVESDGYVSIEAEHYSSKTDRGGAGWAIIKGLGRTADSVTVLPPTVKSQTDVPGILSNSPLLEYNVYFFSTGPVPLSVDCSPTNPINDEHGSRIAVAFDDETPQIVSPARGKKSAIDNVMVLDSNHSIKSAGPHTLKIWMVDPGIVLDKIVIDTGGVKPSYLGPPESFRNHH